VSDGENTVVESERVVAYQKEEQFIELKSFNYSWEDENNNNKIDINEKIVFYIEINSSVVYNLTLKIVKDVEIVFEERILDQGPGIKDFEINYTPSETGIYKVLLYLEYSDEVIYYDLLEFEVYDQIENEEEVKEIKEEESDIDEDSLEVIEFQYVYLKEEDLKEKGENLLNKYKDLIFKSYEKTEKEDEIEKDKRLDRSEKLEEEIEAKIYPKKEEKSKIYLYTLTIEVLILLLLLLLFFVR